MRNEHGVRLERTGWRDASLSQRHRMWGFNCPMVDVDFLALEFHRGNPAAFVEYKAQGAQLLPFDHPSYAALRRAADGLHIPFLIAAYEASSWWFHILPQNAIARQIYSGRVLSEHEYVSSLYFLRGLRLPDNLASLLNTYKPN